jgi:hypothetical protein
MNQAWSVPAGAIATLVLAFGSCSTIPQPSSLSESQAMTLALQLANDEAMRLFQVKPFTTNRCDLQCPTNRWTWQALIGCGKADMRAKVSFDLDGSNPKTIVEMLISYPQEPLRYERQPPQNLQREIRPLPEQWKE